jgi:hypothetical protein
MQKTPNHRKLSGLSCKQASAERRTPNAERLPAGGGAKGDQGPMPEGRARNTARSEKRETRREGEGRRARPEVGLRPIGAYAPVGSLLSARPWFPTRNRAGAGAGNRMLSLRKGGRGKGQGTAEKLKR